MVLKVGDSGVIVEYINAFFDIDSNLYTKETAKRVQQFQQSYLQKFSHTPNVYTDSNIMNSYLQLVEDESLPTYRVESRDILSPLYPTGEVDILTMTAILGMDIDYNDYTKIKQVQQCLTGTEYSKFENIFKMLVEMAQNLDFRLDDNLDYIPTLVDGEIKRILEDPNEYTIESDHTFEQGNLANYPFQNVTLFGKSSVSSSPYRQKSGQYISIEDKLGNNIPLNYCSLFSGLSTLTGQTPTSPKYLPEITSLDVLQIPDNLLTSSKLETLLSYINEYEPRMTNSVYTLGGSNFDIIPGTSNEVIRFPVVLDYIPSADRNLYVNVLENSQLFLYRNKSGLGVGFEEYLVLLDRNWQVQSILSLDSTEGLITINIPLGIIRVGYLYKADPDESGQLTNLGIYQTASSIHIDLTKPLLNCFDYRDEYEITGGKLISRNSKLVLTSLTEVSIENIGGRVYLTTTIPNIQLSSSVLFMCSHYSSDLRQDGTKVYLYDSNKTTLESWTLFIQSQVTAGSPITIWYVTNNEIYTNQTTHAPTLHNFKYLKSSVYQMEVHYQRHPNAQQVQSDIDYPNPYYPSTITGSGQNGQIELKIENEDASLVNGTTLTLSEPLYGLDEGSNDIYDVTEGIIYKRSHRLILTGNEHTITLSPYSGGKYIVFSIPGLFTDRRLTYSGVCNYFSQIDEVWLGQNQGFSFSSAGPENLYISIDIRLLRVGRNSTAIEKIEAFRNWIRAKNSSGTPVEIYWISKISPTIENVDPVTLYQYSNYTRIYNDSNSPMKIKLNITTGLVQSEVIIKGLQDEGAVDLADKISDKIEVTGFYNKQTIESIRRFQQYNDIGQDTDFGRWYSGILNIPTYNALKKEFGLIEEVE